MTSRGKFWGATGGPAKFLGGSDPLAPLAPDSEAIFRVFQLFSQEVKKFYQKNTWKNSQIIFI